MDNPKHIAIILDGNRRYAKKKGIMPWDGHKKGADNVKNLLEWCKDLDIKELTLYCFSVKNFKRDKAEVDFLMKLFENFAKKTLESKEIEENKVRIRFIGKLEMLPSSLQKVINELMEKTKDYSDYKVNICLAYGGREEIIDAVNKAIEKGEKVDEESFRKLLYLDNDPDLVIRTSGEHRMSDFLTWHITYSEYFFTEKHWPEFEKEDLVKIIDEFKGRERRFGG